jgi:hypothetical protein
MNGSIADSVSRMDWLNNRSVLSQIVGVNPFGRFVSAVVGVRTVEGLLHGVEVFSVVWCGTKFRGRYVGA